MSESIIIDYKNKESVTKMILESLEGKNLNLLVGAGASQPFLKDLKINNYSLSFEDIFELSLQNKNKYPRVYSYLCACFLFNSIVKGTYELICKKESEDCKKVKENYKSLINNLYKILMGNSIQTPKRVNIFTTNYDMFFEYTFDALTNSNPNIYFNDGSYGFVKKKISSTRFHVKVTSVGVDNRYDFEMPMFNLIKLHGSLNWNIDSKEDLLINNESIFNNSFSEPEKEEINKLNDFISNLTADQIIETINVNIENDYEKYEALLNELAIIKPCKRKFSETVLEEHYYQLLRILSQELEREKSILLCFGFSFRDEHILSIIKRSLNNPSLLIYVFCYNEDAIKYCSEKFEGYNNVILIGVENDILDFNRFNDLLGVKYA